jgi:hypothetical protein
MEKLRKSIKKNINPVRLYIDDVESIIEILKDFGSDDISIITENYRYDYSELNTIKDFANIIEIQTKKPTHISIDFDDLQRGVELYSEDNSILPEGAITKLFELLKNKERKIVSILFNLKLFTFAVFLLMLLSMIVSFSEIFDIKTMFNVLVLQLGVTFLWSLLVFIIPIFTKVNIFQYEKRPSSGVFWKEDFPKIALTLGAFASLTAIITFFF